MMRQWFSGDFRSQRGVSVIAAIFLLLLFAGLAALMANVISTAHTASALDVLGARAYQAARAGVEWGLYKVVETPDSGATTVVPAGTCNAEVTLPKCPTSIFPANPEGFGVTVDCEEFPSAAPFYYEESCRRIRIFRLTATAKGPGPAGLIVERQVQVTAEKCLDAATGADC